MINSMNFRAPSAFGAIQQMKADMSMLQIQLATGKRAQSLSELGGQRMFDFALRGRVSDIEAYQSSITMVDLRLEFMGQSMTRMDEIEKSARSSAQMGTFDLNGQNFTSAQTLAKANLDEMFDQLNLHVNGRYLFAGTDTAEKPVKTYDVIMNGDGAQAGFKTVNLERRAADMGTGDRGRTDVTMPTTTSVQIAEDGDHPFGMKLAAVAAESGNLTLTQPNGTAPQTLTVDFTGQPSVDEHILISFDLPDGTRETMEMHAVDSASSVSGDFVIGATTADTAANFEAALNTKIQELTATKLKAASAFAAADDFFAKNGETVMRATGGGSPETATALTAGSSADTVIWYTGDDLSSGVRQSVSAKVDSGTRVSYGVQGNEDGMVQLIRSLAAFSTEPIDSADTTGVGLYESLNGRVREQLAETNNGNSGSIEGIIIELGMAKSTLSHAKNRHNQNTVTLETMLGEIEDISAEEVGMKMLSLKTRLEASYQATSMISQLTLVNYMR